MMNKHNIVIRILAYGMLSLVCLQQVYSSGVYAAPSGTFADNLQPSYFTGQTGYAIPIYKLNDADFPLKIVLRYESEGFKPFQPSGCYGQDWSLLAGGYISRVVQDFPDEQFVSYENINVSYEVLTGMHHQFIDGWMPDKNRVFDMSSPEYHNNMGVVFPYDTVTDMPVWQKMDYMPDIFYFNFMGYQGRFVINNQGVPKVIAGDYVDIDISRLYELYLENNYINENHMPKGDSIQITITTQDGYKYIFGGVKESVEWTVLSDDQYQQVPSISAWYLSTIIAPNGRKMSFEYVKESGNNLSYQLRFFSTDYDWTGEYRSRDNTQIMHTLHKRCLLKSITTSDSVPLNISFSSSQEAFPMYQNTNLFYSKKNLKLDSIRVAHGNRILATAQLDYAWQRHSVIYGMQPNYYWRYLSSVHISGVGTYSLNYNEIGSPINPAIVNYPDLYVTTDAAYEAMVDRFGFWRTTSLQGMLSKVTLPTGGFIQFSYGRHLYGEERRFHKVDTSNVTLYARSVNNHYIGGARIEQIKMYSDANTLVETQEFTYNKPGTTQSSGIYYNIYEIFDAQNDEVGKAITHPNNYGMIESHIGYSSVERKTTIGEESYKTIYTFDTGHKVYSSANDTANINRNTNVNGYADSTELRSGSLTYVPRLVQTGKLLAVEQYRGSSKQKATYYRYNGIENTATLLPDFDGTHLGCTDTIICLSTYSGHVARKLFVYPCVLEQSVSYEYASNGESMVSSISYTRDSRFREKRVTSIDSRGITHFTRYKYPDEFDNSDWLSPYHLLAESKRINIPSEKISGYLEGNNEYVTSGSLNLYAAGEYVVVYHDGHVFGQDTLYYGEVKYYPYLHQTMTLVLNNPIAYSDYVPLTITSSQFTYDPHYKIACEYSFDLRNRPLSVKEFGKVETKYKWAKWDDFYPAAKTIGNQTCTYTYIPYVGVSSETDPRGITTYYTYDSAGRLIEEYRLVNDNKQILNVYRYHRKTE